MNINLISSQELDEKEALDFCSGKESGAVSLFLGMVRNKNNNKEVIRLVYEAYDSMVLSEMKTVIAECRQKWNLDKVYVAHRSGVLEIGDLAFIVACSSAHREASREANSWLVDTLKSRLPIWKKEEYHDGSEWLNSRP